MGQTIRRTRTYEVVIACEDCAPLASGHERKQAGDIIGLRPITAPQAGTTGTAERHRYLWLTLDLTDEQVDGLLDGNGGHDKRRYQIPLGRLAQLVPGFSVARARDVTDLYQPFLTIDEDDGRVLARHRPVAPDGLILDVSTRRYA